MLSSVDTSNLTALTSLLNSIGGNTSPAPPSVNPQMPDLSGLLPSSGSMGPPGATNARLSRDASGSASNLLGQVGQYVPPPSGGAPDSSDPLLLSDPLDPTGEGGRGLTEIANLLTQTSAQLMNGLSRSNSSSPVTALPQLGQYVFSDSFTPSTCFPLFVHRHLTPVVLAPLQSR